MPTIACPACGHTQSITEDKATDMRCARCGILLAADPASRREALQAVQGPATALLTTAWIGIACSVLVLAYLGLRIAWLPASSRPPEEPVRTKLDPSAPPRPLPSGITQADRLYAGCWLAVVGPCWAVVVWMGARHMRRLGHYESARMGCIMAMVPLNLAWLAGLPVGLRGLRVLRRPEIRSAFVRISRLNLG